MNHIANESRAEKALLWGYASLVYLFLYAPTYGFAVRDRLIGLSPTPFSPTWNSYTWSTRD